MSGVDAPEDILKKDPKFQALQKKSTELKNQIEEKTEEKPLTEEEEKEKFDKELKGLEIEGEKVKTASQLKDAKASLKKLEEDEKESGEP